MKGLFTFLCLAFVASLCLCVRVIADPNPSFNVVNYGAKGDNQTDDSQAFLKAWKDVCGATAGTPTLFIPKGKTFMLQPVFFQGACKPLTINVQLQGNIVAPKSVDAWKWPSNDIGAWIQFSSINSLVVNGGGGIDGQGAAWWNCNSNANCPRPSALNFSNCPNLQLSDLTHNNSPRNHIGINGCNGAHISNLHIMAPVDSPNTDGIDIAASSNIIIQHSIIKTGDDCIAINGGSSFINITDVACGPGHGISIGSLGANGQHETVEEIHVQNCNFTNNQNGVRIKTYVGGYGYAKKITFEDITLIAAQNPIIIDQHYNAVLSQFNVTKAVEVSEITYRNVHGTSAVENAIQLNCDNSIGCNNNVLDEINITSSVPGGKTSASRSNAHGTCSSCIAEIPCLLK